MGIQVTPPHCTVNELRHAIKIQTAVKATDAAGSKIPTGAFTHFADAHARIRTTAAKETKRGAVIELQTTHVITIRYRAGINPKMSIEFGSRRFQIAGVAFQALHAGGNIYFDAVQDKVVLAEERFHVRGRVNMVLLGQATPVDIEEEQIFQLRLLERLP